MRAATLILQGGYFAACLLAASHAWAQSCAALPATAGQLPVAVTPVTLRILQTEIVPVPGTDGLTHLAYAAQVTNLSPNPSTVQSVVPVDPLEQWAPTGTNRVLDTHGLDITGKVRLFAPPPHDGSHAGSRRDFTAIPAGASGVAFFDITYENPSDVPRLVAHRLTVGLRGEAGPMTEQTSPVPVACRPPVVLRPPLTGLHWWDGNGCCRVVSPHRGATLPINGILRAPEQFAIDFVQISNQGTCCTGPVKALGSWPFFGTPVLAAADGTVAEIADGMPEQVPGPPVGVTAANAAGNHIIEAIGEGRYILYAHLRTGSIPASLHVGSRLASGQKIGALGNSGSTTAPHLHFQVMDRPSALSAVGLPFVFDEQVLEGSVTGNSEAADDAYEAGRAVPFDPKGGGVQTRRMPIEGQVFGFQTD